MTLPELSGARLGPYLMRERLGEGAAATVYRAVHEPTERTVALKVLEPVPAGRPGFLARLRRDSEIVTGLGRPGILPVYEVATAEGLTFVSQRLIAGGSVRELLRRGRPEPDVSWRMLSTVGEALDAAHAAGVVHRDLRPSNVLLAEDGSALVADFGLAPTSYGYAVGTPGYMSPEQAMGLEVGPRSDIHALALLAFELLTGSRAYTGATPLELILAVADGPVPSIRAVDPRFPDEVDEVFIRALAKVPTERPATAAELLGELGRMPVWRSLAAAGRPVVAPAWFGGIDAAGSDPRPETPSQTAPDQLRSLVEAAPEAVVGIDAAGLVTICNAHTESVLGWSRDELVGRPFLATIVASRYREVLEHLLADLGGSGRAGPETQSIEVDGLHREGREVPLEVSLSVVSLPSGDTTLLAFCRDISERLEAERLRLLHDELSELLVESPPPGDLLARVLEAAGRLLEWPVVLAWRVLPGGSALHCEDCWRAPGFGTAELELVSRKTSLGPGSGLAGRAWADGAPVWAADLAGMADSDRERAALAAGLRAAGGFPIRAGAELIGALEVFSSAPGRPGKVRLAEMEALGRHLGKLLQRGWAGSARAESAAIASGGRVRYRIDTRNSHLGFSCAFMRFMTVHGLFKDFTGWLEIEGDDPKSVQAECRLKTASVDSGSLERDHHLRSSDFFAVEAHPEMIFRSTSVEPMDEGRFRVFGRLTIRDVARPIRLDVRLEDRETEAGAERVTLTATTIINRRDWFLDWERALQAGRWLVGEEVRLDLVVTLVRRALAAEPAR
ncbi:MAG: YceI family protein [Candidatus Dormibacteraeota bacterium]|nr:YceI family protein [Candidatus Dormibacteraeota bacterium]